jgi:hypothetical protein
MLRERRIQTLFAPMVLERFEAGHGSAPGYCLMSEKMRM